MKAVGFHEHGDIDNFQLLDVPRPDAGRGEVVVEVHAAALNHQDLFAIRELEHYVPDYPFWGGADVAGEVDEVGEGVEGWSVGDRVVVNPIVSCDRCEFCKAGEHSMCESYRVFGEHIKGGHAEYVVVPAENLVTLPDGFDATTAAAVPLAAGTAWRALTTRGRIAPFDDVLVLGATGGVGSYAVQIARNVYDVDTLYATTSTAEKAEFLEGMGVDHVINYHEEEFDQVVWELTDKRGVDLIYNNVGGYTWTKGLRSLCHGGRMVTSGATAGPNPETEIRLIFVRQLEVVGSTTFTRAEFDRMLDYVWDGTIEPVIQETFALEEYAEAFEMMADRQLYGKILFEMK